MTTNSKLLGRRTIFGLAAASAAFAGTGWGMVDPFPPRPAPRVMPQVPPAPPLPAPVPLPPIVPPRRVTHRFPASPQDLAEWELFKRRFVSADGRVVDTGNGGVSHSEGQGWGMMFAVAFNDRTTFDLLHDWTRRNLSRAYDGLHAWRYLPRAAVPVPDHNSASDADLFIAAALGRAACQWDRPELARQAERIAKDMLRLVVREVGGRVLLLPGAVGFEQTGSVTVNLSYYAFPRFEEMNVLAPSTLWQRLGTDGMKLLQDARFGHWQLPPDWLMVNRATGALQPHPHWPTRFSYDAIRVPLWLAWSGQTPSEVGRGFASYWAQQPQSPPAWVDLVTNAQANYQAPPGMMAVARVAAIRPQRDLKAALPTSFPAIRASPDYYSAALILLSRLAWQESSGV